MAQIAATTNERIFSIGKWLGLNQNPDGDTKLKYGEAAVMENWRITRDGNLRRRPGMELVAAFGTSRLGAYELGNAALGYIPGPVRCLWSGLVAGKECMLAACDGILYRLFNGTDWVKEEIGEAPAENDLFVFGFADKAYILDGDEYRVYDGTTLSVVEGYRPLVVTAAVPSGGGTTLEQANKLNGLRRVQYSPDGEATVFTLPEKNLVSLDYVTNLVTGASIECTADLSKGTVTFTSAPEKGTNTVEIGYTVQATDREGVTHMRYAELFNGSQDSRVFLYGDGTNQAIYSGLDSNGQGRADYFPDLNVANIGESNTPITAMVRHGSRLLAYKTNSTYSIAYGSISLADGSMTAGFYITPVHRSLGNAAPGQAQVVLNYPRTLHGEDIIEWKNASTYYTADERQAKVISDRVQATIKQFDFAKCKCWDDNDNQEYYICYDKQALVHNYAADAWYYYTNFDAVVLTSFRNDLYIGTSEGRVLRLSDSARSDCGEVIHAYWESGAMDFKADYMRKYTSMIWVSVKPETKSYVEVSVRTDRKSDFAEKVISKSVSGFGDMDFTAFSFVTSSRPQTKRLRIKAKKYAYYKLIFQTSEPDTTATVLAADIRVRQTGYAK
jgi:hypothetical protein